MRKVLRSVIMGCSVRSMCMPCLSMSRCDSPKSVKARDADCDGSREPISAKMSPNSGRG